MAQIEAYLKRFFSECNLSFLDDYYDLYEFVPNEELRKLLAAFHTQLNHWFAVLNQDIIVQYDEDGNPIYSGVTIHSPVIGIYGRTSLSIIPDIVQSNLYRLS